MGSPDAVIVRSPMFYQRIAPPADLASLVESLWIQEGTPDPTQPRARVLPTGMVEILFHYGDPFVHLDEDPNRALPRTYVTGQRTHAVVPSPLGEVGIILVSLFPWAVRTLLPVPPAELTDGYRDLGEVMDPTRVRAVEERLRGMQGARGRLTVVLGFLRELRTGQGAPSVIRMALRRFDSPAASLRVNDVARDLEFSPRHLRRSFADWVGVSPKVYLRIRRFQRALMARRGGFGWAQVAAECAYSDQAHLIHEVRAFAGQTPGQVDRAPGKPSDLFNGVRESRERHVVYL